MEKLENGGSVILWSGWSINLPRACIERNQDGSWSAWGNDWTLDITIIDMSGDAEAKPVPPDRLLGNVNEHSQIKGRGWIGSRTVLQETDQGRPVLRVATKLCAANTVMLCWVSILDEHRIEFAFGLIDEIIHTADDGNDR